MTEFPCHTVRSVIIPCRYMLCTFSAVLSFLQRFSPCRVYCRILVPALALFAACSEHVAVNDIDAMNLRFRVKSVNESFYIARSSFNKIILQRKIYEAGYGFDYSCRLELTEKEVFINNGLSPACDSSRIDSCVNLFPFAMKEPDYRLVRFSHVADTVTVSESCDRNGNIRFYTRRIHKNSRPYSEEVFSAANDLISRTKFWYDRRNRLVNRTAFYRNEYSETAYEYSPCEKIETDSEFVYKYRFDLDGRVTVKKTYAGATPFSETLYFYNRHGDPVLEKEICNDGKIRKTAYEYAYDSKNNWILCTEYSYSGNIFVRTRTITYF